MDDLFSSGYLRRQAHQAMVTFFAPFSGVYRAVVPVKEELGQHRRSGHSADPSNGRSHEPDAGSI